MIGRADEEKLTAHREPCSDYRKGLTVDDDDNLIKIYILKQKPPVESRCNHDAKYTEGGGNHHLTKNICTNMELIKYTQYRILVPHNNGNVKLI